MKNKELDRYQKGKLTEKQKEKFRKLRNVKKRYAHGLLSLKTFNARLFEFQND